MKNSARGDDNAARADGGAIGVSWLSPQKAKRRNEEDQLDERVRRHSEKWSNPESPNPGCITDRVDGIGGVEPSAADPFASD